MAAVAYAFDVPPRQRDAVGPQAERRSEMWRIKRLAYTWTLSLMGRFHDFCGSQAASLDAAAAAGCALDAERRAEPVGAYEEPAVLRVFKPKSKVYGLVGRHRGTTPDEVTLLPSNRWNVAGATAFRFRMVWMNRTGKADDLPLTRVIATLEELL